MIYDLRDRNSYNVWNGRGGIADILSAALISPMLQRDAAARDYKYQSRLAAEAAQRQADSEAAKRGAYDTYTTDLADAFSGMGPDFYITPESKPSEPLLQPIFFSYLSKRLCYAILSP